MKNEFFHMKKVFKYGGKKISITTYKEKTTIIITNRCLTIQERKGGIRKARVGTKEKFNNMKILKVAVPLCLIAAGCIFFVGCDKDSDPLDESSDLDANHMVQLSTRSAPQDIIQNNFSFKVVPKEENECMLNAMLQIAVDKHLKVFGKYISSDNPASSAYAEVKEYAMNYVKTDENGNRVPGYKQYEGGEMLPSLAAETGKKSGILSGNTLHFDSYEKMQETISSEQWRNNHPDGTYIINSESEKHSSICTGFTKDGTVKTKSAQYGYNKMDPTKNNYTGFTIVY
jgi:hypothetical protein